MPSSLVEINGHTLFVEIAGSGPPFISMHGLGGSTNLFPIATMVAEHFTVIRFDFQGSGKSPFGDGNLTMPGFVSDCKAVLEYAGFKGVPAVLFGHSMGAAAALHFSGTHPDLVAALILSCPGVSRSATPEGRAMSAGLAKLAREQTPFNMADFTAMKNTGPNATCVMKGLIRAAMQESGGEAYAQTCEMLSVTPNPEWSKIVAKTMIVAGIHDQISSVQAAHTIAGCLTETKVRVEPVEAGHQPAVECPDELFALLKSFLEF